MGLSTELISQFVKITKKNTESKKSETVVYGTAVVSDGSTYVKIDGSDLLTPVGTTIEVNDGERVTVMIKDHTATITGSTTTPSASTNTTNKLNSQIANVNKLVADKADVKELEAEVARIDTLVTENVVIKEKVTASEGEINDLKTDNLEVKEKLTAAEASIEKLDAEKISADAVDAKYATIKNLEAANAEINTLRVTQGNFEQLTTGNFAAVNASIKNLETDKLSVKDADIKYANIDFSNIEMAAVKKIFSDSGIIKDLVVGDQKITGELVGVTIKGDLIEAGTVKADKLVVKGSDGIFYKLNVDAAGMSKEEAPTDSLHGSLITAKSIVAEKIAVDDLVAFGATIGGFHITNNSIYSGVKSTVDNTTRGVYMDDDGQFGLGDSNNFIKFYKDLDGSYKLAISAGSIKFGTSRKNIEEEIETLKDEISTVLRIESSRGTVFKNDSISTVLSAVIYRGSQRITDMTTLKKAMGQSTYLQWKWQRLNEDSFGVISADDKRIGNEGFTFTLSPDDVNTKVTFICELIN